MKGYKIAELRPYASNQLISSLKLKYASAGEKQPLALTRQPLGDRLDSNNGLDIKGWSGKSIERVSPFKNKQILRNKMNSIQTLRKGVQNCLPICKQASSKDYCTVKQLKTENNPCDLKHIGSLTQRCRFDPDSYIHKRVGQRQLPKKIEQKEQQNYQARLKQLDSPIKLICGNDKEQKSKFNDLPFVRDEVPAQQYPVKFEREQTAKTIRSIDSILSNIRQTLQKK